MSGTGYRERNKKGNNEGDSEGIKGREGRCV